MHELPEQFFKNLTMLHPSAAQNMFEANITVHFSEVNYDTTN